MADVISHPFRLGAADGRIATVTQGSEREVAERLAVILLTRRGERPMATQFGIIDPAFNRVEQSDIAFAVNLYGPEIEISDVREVFINDRTLEVQVVYE